MLGRQAGSRRLLTNKTHQRNNIALRLCQILFFPSASPPPRRARDETMRPVARRKDAARTHSVCVCVRPFESVFFFLNYTPFYAGETDMCVFSAWECCIGLEVVPLFLVSLCCFCVMARLSFLWFKDILVQEFQQVILSIQITCH
jgi:hypothetical protein